MGVGSVNAGNLASGKWSLGERAMNARCPAAFKKKKKEKGTKKLKSSCLLPLSNPRPHLQWCCFTYPGFWCLTFDFTRHQLGTLSLLVQDYRKLCKSTNLLIVLPPIHQPPVVLRMCSSDCPLKPVQKPHPDALESLLLMRASDIPWAPKQQHQRF